MYLWWNVSSLLFYLIVLIFLSSQFFTSSPLPETVWLKDGMPIQPNERVTQGNYGKSLVFRKVKFEDKGKYTCEVSNGVGSPQSYNIELDVMGIKLVKIFTVTVN